MPRQYVGKRMFARLSRQCKYAPWPFPYSVEIGSGMGKRGGLGILVPACYGIFTPRA
jgi:hypothetical protein